MSNSLKLLELNRQKGVLVTTFEREKKYESIPASQDLIREMLAMVDSNSMRNYLAETANKYNVYRWIDLIAGAPKAMDLKLELLRKLSSVDMDPEALNDLNNVIELGELLMDQLYHMNPETSVLVATYYDSRTPDAFEIGKSRMFCSYDDVLEDIRNTFPLNEDASNKQVGLRDCYIHLRLYDLYARKPEDLLRDKWIEYYCDADGTVYFGQSQYRPRDSREPFERLSNTFSGKEGLLNWPSPFRIGDILYTDMRPWYLPSYNLLYWYGQEMPADCCAMQCLYPSYGGLIENNAFKHGHFLPQVSNAHCDRPFFSPLYRTERYTGELPEEYAFMKPLSEKLKQTPDLSQKLDDFLMDYPKGTSKCVSVVPRPVPVEKPKDLLTDQETNVIWHPDQIQWEPWDKTGTVIGITKKQLNEIAGIVDSDITSKL